ncbi:aldo/keto reductase [Cochleicola gelatinilyticus]|uniref:Alcohol dehydrogenase n=1 Tax=Cochleicola gelatinilyticus TaxID=1763537 RepID=A0A167GYR4_9FLAO|nr:aldo/keto reductase [Cochleicola gelatinilyticus]OAB78042.1 alcohol dehydrogenase [Cochleicola gelatinilyticus]
MKKITLGTTELKISPLIFGGNVFGWTLNEKESFAMLDAIFEMGINCIDTADVYSRWFPGNKGGESETIIGKWMKARGNRDEMIICTKVGMDVGQGGIDLSEKHILTSIDNSLKRLQTDYVDLYYAHKDDKTTAPSETLGAFKKLLDTGKIKHIGASNFSSERLQQSLQLSEETGLPKYAVYQPEYNLLVRNNFSEENQMLCKKHDLATVTYFSLASGLLTGKYSSKEDLDASSRTDYVKKHWNKETRQALKIIESISKNHTTSMAAVSLAWLLAQPQVTAPIVSATKKSHLIAFREAVSLQLSALEIEKLNKLRVS